MSVDVPEQASRLPRLVVVLLGAAGVVVAVQGLMGIADFFAPVFLGLVLVICVQPVRRRLERRAPSWFATVVTLVLLYAILLLILIGLVVSVAELVALLPEYEEQFDRLVDEVVALAAGLGISEQQVRDALDGVNPSSVIDALGSVFAGVSDTVTALALLLSVMVFLAADAAGFPHRLVVLARSQPYLAGGLQSFAEGVRRYLVVSTVFGAIVAVLDTVALALLGVPLALLWGLLAFLTNYIPNVGFVIGLLPPALLALLDGGWRTALAVIVIYCVLNVLIQSVVQPRFTGDAVGLTPTVTFLSLIFWAFVLGPLGALLALPMSLLVKNLLVDADPSARWIDALVAVDPEAAGESPRTLEAKGRSTPGRRRSGVDRRG